LQQQNKDLRKTDVQVAPNAIDITKAVSSRDRANDVRRQNLVKNPVSARQQEAPARAWDRPQAQRDQKQAGNVIPQENIFREPHIYQVDSPCPIACANLVNGRLSAVIKQAYAGAGKAMEN
jgi:hypothetical protein